MQYGPPVSDRAVRNPASRRVKFANALIGKFFEHPNAGHRPSFAAGSMTTSSAVGPETTSVLSTDSPPTDRLAVGKRAATGKNGGVTVNGVSTISDRESEVLDALRARLTNAEIARQLHISIRTVESHVSSLLRKLGALDRRELADLASPAGVESSVVQGHLVGLPMSWTSFIGRAEEVDELCGLGPVDGQTGPDAPHEVKQHLTLGHRRVTDNPTTHTLNQTESIIHKY